MWDVFISHASEDKDTLVKGLAERLKSYGVKVWYDEFELKLGDSLSASIDKGLLDSHFGIVVLSPNFFDKQWTDYELRSLITKEISSRKTILTIWHEADKKFIESKSLYLADKKALNSSVGIETLAEEILKVVRPDIVNSYNLKELSRKLRKDGKKERKSIKDLKFIDGVRHETLPLHLIMSTRLFTSIFNEFDYEEMLTNFAKDMDYDKEFLIWTVISCVYIDALREYDLSLNKTIENERILEYLILLSLGDERCNEIQIDETKKEFITRAYYEHMSVLHPILFGEN